MKLPRIEDGLCFENIMTDEVLFYDEEFDKDCKNFCNKRNITYLPWRKDTSFCYKLSDNKFKKMKITKSQTVKTKEDVFQNSVVEKFRKHQVLFVYNESCIAGVVHFCDYNKNLVSVYGYTLLLEFEKRLRKLLFSKGLNNDDMLEFFLKHNNNQYYFRKDKEFKKKENRAKMKELEPFQMFCLKDLIGLLNYKKIHKVPCEINDDLRNTIMHSKNVVKHKNYIESNLIYNFSSFLKFIDVIKLLNQESKKVSEKIPKEECKEELRRLRQAGLFIKI